MITYIDEVALFSENEVQQRYREELGIKIANHVDDTMACMIANININLLEAYKALGISSTSFFYLYSQNAQLATNPTPEDIKNYKQQYPEAFL